MRRFRYEPALYFLAFALALFVRLVKLGSLPLSDAEAVWALQALGVAQGTRPLLGSQPAYILLTSVVFYLLGAGTVFMARLVPALVGSALALVPALFSSRLKPRPAVILAFLLALDPGLVALSRQAGSGILAVTFVLVAWGLWEDRHAAWAGVFAGLALMSGPAVWAGLLGLALTWGILQLVEQGWRNTASPDAPEQVQPAASDWWTAVAFAAGSIVVFGTLFFLAPNGLSAWASALSDYVTGWLKPSGVPAGLMLFSLVAYEPLAVILAILVTLRGWIRGSLRIRRLSLWALVALLVALFDPARQVSDLEWMLIPLWALASLELARALNVRPEERLEVLGVAALTLVILAFIWLNFLGLLQAPVATEQNVLRTWLLFGSFFLLFISVMLVAVGWSLRAARYGAVLGLTVALGLYSIGVMAGAAGLRSIPGAAEMWSAGSNPPGAGLVLTTVDQISDWSKDNIDSQPVTIAGLDSPALRWLLRDHAVTVVPVLGASSAPPIIITPGGQNNPALAARYRGQELVWIQAPQWNQTGFADWFGWLGFHQILQNPQKVIVWVRDDLFLDASTSKP